MIDFKKAEAVVDTYMRAMTEGNLEQVVDLYADEAILEDPVGTDVLNGKAAITEFYKGALQAKIVLERIGQVRLASNELTFPFRCEYNGPDGPVAIEIIDHFILNEDHKIISMRAFWGENNTKALTT